MNKILKKIAAVTAASAMTVSLVGCMPEKRSGAEQYDKAYYVREYRGDMRSNLSVFPDTVENGRVIFFRSALSVSLFDTDGYILLEYRCDADQIAAEEERLGAISFTIRGVGGQTFTNNVMYDENSYNYPAYVATDGFKHTYEYALIDRDGGRIVYIFATYVMPDKFRYNLDSRKNMTSIV